MKKLRALKDGMLGKSGGLISCTHFFIPEDNEVKFKENCETQPADWFYRTETITYQYNQYGHRCVDIDNLGEDYILFAGCSHTEGIGLKLENTYPHLVSQYYNKPYYNLAVGGSGPYLTMFNLLGFLSKVKHKPSLVIIQWPNFYRYFDISDLIHCYQMIFYTPSYRDDYYDFMLKNNLPMRHNKVYRQIALQHLKNYGITNIIESYDSDFESEDDTLIVRFPGTIIDHARDLCHGGILTNQSWANDLINAINKNFAHVFKL